MTKKDKPKNIKFDLTLVGARYKLNERDLEYLETWVDEEGFLTCKLEPEPDNEVDPKAIKVICTEPEHYLSGRLLGYVARPVNEKVLELLNRKIEVRSCKLTFFESSGTGELEVRIRKPND